LGDQLQAALFSFIASCRLHRLDPEQYLDEVMRLLPYWRRERFLELAPIRWLATRAKLDPEELARPLGSFTIPPR
jgi:transposase